MGVTARTGYSSIHVKGVTSSSVSGNTSANTTALQTANQGFRLNFDYKMLGFSAGTHRVFSTNGIGISTTGAETINTINALQARYKDKGILAEATYTNNKAESESMKVYKNAAMKSSARYKVTPTVTPFIQYVTGVIASTASLAG